MKKILTLSAAMLVMFTAAEAKTAKNSLGAAILKNHGTAGKTTATKASRLISEGSDYDKGSGFGLADSTTYTYSGARGFYNELLDQWDYDVSTNYDVNAGVASSHARSTCTYDGNNHLTIMLNEEYDGSKWVSTERYTVSYNANGKISSFIMEEDQGSGLQKAYQYTLSYDANGNNTVMLQQDWYNNTWANSFRTTNTYNSSNQITLTLEEKFLLNSWLPTTRTTNTYVGANLTLAISANYNGSTFTDAGRTTNTYDGSNNMLTSETGSLNGSTYTASQRSVYTYDANHNVLTQEDSYDMNGSGTLQKSGKSINTYNSYSQILTAENQSWDASTSSYQKSAYSRSHYQEFNVGVNEVPEAMATLHAYPNPATNTLNINMSFNQPLAAIISLQDLTGKTVKAWVENAATSSKKTINTAELPNGTYMLRVQAGAKSISQKVVIAH